MSPTQRCPFSRRSSSLEGSSGRQCSVKCNSSWLCLAIFTGMIINNDTRGPFELIRF